MLIGETYLPNIAELDKQYGTAGKPEFQLPMDTQIGFINKLDVATFRARLERRGDSISAATRRCCFSTTTTIRASMRATATECTTRDIERVISTILFASRGASLFYYGDEIGMKTTPPTRKEDVKDPVGITGWPKEKGRDGERTPMQWDADRQRRLYGPKEQSPGCRSHPTTQPSMSRRSSATLTRFSTGMRALIRLKKTNRGIRPW